MKLQIKTLNRKILVIEMEETKTIFNLKQELAMYADVSVPPEQQEIIYEGQVLDDDWELSACKINVRKFLVVMLTKASTAETAQSLPSASSSPATAAANNSLKGAIAKTSTSTPARANKGEDADKSIDTATKRENMVAFIVAMGYDEADVRAALVASSYLPERAIEYLLNGMPANETNDSIDAGSELGVRDILRIDPRIRDLRDNIAYDPQFLDAAIRRIGENCPSLLSLVADNRADFLKLMIDGDNPDDDDVEIVEDDNTAEDDTAEESESDFDE